MSIRFTGARAGFSPRNGDYYHFSEPTTTTAKDVFSNAGLSTPISQPVTADANGLLADVFMSSELYRVRAYRASGTLIYDVDLFDPGVAAGSTTDGSVLPVALGGTGATNAAAARGNIGAASATTVTALSATVSGLDVLVDTGLHTDGDRFGALASEDAVTPDLMSGVRVMVKRGGSTTIATSTTTTGIPVDNTTPQAGEGVTLIDTVTFTPSRTDSEIIVRGRLTFQQSAANEEAVIALIRNAAGNAVSAVAGSNAGANRWGQIDVLYRESPGATTPIDYKLIMGISGGTLKVNGATDDTLGGSMAGNTFLEIEEWATIA